MFMNKKNSKKKRQARTAVYRVKQTLIKRMKKEKKMKNQTMLYKE